MKTIRHSTFESNSSSTHTITIDWRSQNNRDGLPIFDGVTFYPGALGGYEKEVGEGSYLTCDNKYLKAAWLISVIKLMELEHKYYNFLPENGYHDLMREVGESVADRVDLSEISDRYWSAEDGNGSLRFEEGEYVKNRQIILDFVRDVVLNDDLIINDSNIPY